MEKKLVLNASVRTPEEKVKHLRNEQIVPWVVYWKKQEPISLKFDYSDFLKLYRIAWESKIVKLAIEDWKSIDVLVYEVRKNPINWEFQHVDFYAITKWEKVTTNIPLTFVWTAKATIDWAIIQELMKEIEVKVLPTDLVDFIEVDITSLENIWDSIRVSDLKIDTEKFELLANPDDMVIVATKPVEEKIEDEAPVEWEWEEGAAEWAAEETQEKDWE